MTKITASTITVAQIKGLAREAAEAGDMLTTELCAIALSYAEDGNTLGDDIVDPISGKPITRADARDALAEIINDAAAMAD